MKADRRVQADAWLRPCSARPFYIGKARHFGTKQASDYKATARYNSGYLHLIAGMLGGGFNVYVACVGQRAFAHVEKYEQELIARG